MVDRIWYPRPKWRTGAWHIENDEHKQKGYLFVQYIPEQDLIGAPTGKGHLMVWERWPSFGHGDPSDSMPEKDALKALKEIEAECDEKYKKVNDRVYEHLKALSEEYHDAKPYREHPDLVAEQSVTLNKNTASMKPLRFNAVAQPGGSSSSTATPERPTIDDRSWRTDAHLVENFGYHKISYTTFCELRPHQDADQDHKGMVQFVTWRMGPNSVYCQKDETHIRSALERISYFEYQHRDCPKASPATPGALALPPEYFKAMDYHTHPHLNPEDVTVGRQVSTLKSLKLKPK